MKTTPRLPMHLPGVDPLQFPELRYFRFEQQSVWAAALFGFFEGLRLPRFQYLRLQVLSSIRENPHIPRKEVLCFLLDPKTKAEAMLAAWNYGPDLIPLVFESARLVTNAAGATSEDIDQAIQSIIPVIMLPSEQPLPAERYSPAIYVLHQDADWAALLYAYHAPESYAITDCGHIALKANLFADARSAMQKPLRENEMNPDLVRCRSCQGPIGKGIFALGKKAAQMYPPDLPGMLFSHFTSSSEFPYKAETGASCAYCNSERASFTCFGGCTICTECALLATYSQVYYLRCPACGDRFNKAVCAGIIEELQKRCREIQELPNKLECDHCHGYISCDDIEEVTHGEKTLLVCPSCKPHFNNRSADVEESKEGGSQCVNCEHIRSIQDFKFYLSNKHRCLLCDPCYHQFLLADTTLAKCPGCSEAFTSQVRKSFATLIENRELPNIYCDICGQQQHEREFSEGTRLSHWWKCRVCNGCLSMYQRTGYNVCGACHIPYTPDDKTTIERLLSLKRQSSDSAAELVDDTPKCDLCERPSGSISIKGVGHRCKACNECWEALIDSHWNCACPVCNALFSVLDIQRLQVWRAKRINVPEMNTLAACSLCHHEKPRREMLKSKQLHHTCSTICDACLINRDTFSTCPACGVPYQELDLAISAKLIPKKCSNCHQFLGSAKPKCPNACVCSMCLLENYAFTNIKQCYKCNTQLEGFLPAEMACSGCLRKLTIASTQEDTVFGICDRYCVLCCCCIRIENGRATCTQCGANTEVREVQRIEKLQRTFELGCYCGNNKGKKLTLSCNHKVHKDCQPSLIACRLCGTKYQEKERIPVLNSYVS